MALEPSAEYGAQVDTSDSDYPLGKAKPDIVPGDGNGTPLHHDWMNDIWGFQQALLDSTGTTADGNPDKVGASQYLDALRGGIAPISGELSYVDSGYAATTKERTWVISPVLVRPAQGAAVDEHYMESVELVTNSSSYYFPLPRLPYGASFTNIKVLVQPGEARASSSNRMQCKLARIQSRNFSTPAIGSIDVLTNITQEYDDGTADLQVVTVTPTIPASVTSEGDFSLIIRSGNTAASFADLVGGIQITWADPGPRGY